MLILGRAVAGIGGAGIFTGAFTVLAYTVPLEKRPFYTGAISEFPPPFSFLSFFIIYYSRHVSLLFI